MIWLNLFSFSLHGSNMKSEKNVTWKNISYFVWRLLQCKLKKAKIDYLEKWSDKSVCWQLISTLLLMINKLDS